MEEATTCSSQGYPDSPNLPQNRSTRSKTEEEVKTFSHFCCQTDKCNGNLQTTSLFVLSYMPGSDIAAIVYLEGGREVLTPLAAESKGRQNEHFK
jgi:hypothetical protein